MIRYAALLLAAALPALAVGGCGERSKNREPPGRSATASSARSTIEVTLAPDPLRSEPKGGKGGVPFELRCPDGFVMSGIRGAAGDYVDRVGIVCSKLVTHQQPPTDSATPPASQEAKPAESDNGRAEPTESALPATAAPSANAP